MFPYVVLTRDKTWQPGPHDGVELMVLHKHENTGGVVMLRKFKAGHTPSPLTRTRTPMNGPMSCPGNGRNPTRRTPPDALFYASKGVQQGPHVAKTEVISLTVFDGPLTVV